jgi:hypothetical protein
MCILRFNLRAFTIIGTPPAATIGLMSSVCPVSPNVDHRDRSIHGLGPRAQTPENLGMNMCSEAGAARIVGAMFLARTWPPPAAAG